MKQSAPDRVQGQSLECEFTPPLAELEAAPEARSLPWERQLSAAEAWQAAGGNADSEWDVWAASTADMVVPAVRPAGSSASRPGIGTGESFVPSMRTIMKMNTLLVSLRERLLQIQTEASNVAIAEMAQRQTQAPDENATAAPGPLRPLQEAHARRVIELADSWFEIIAAAQSAMSTLTGRRPVSTAASGAQGARPYVERRKLAMLIDFPERRMAV